MSTADDLLRRALDAWDDEFQNLDNASIFRKIRAYLANKNQSESINTEEIDRSKKPMTDEQCWKLISEDYRMEEYSDAAYELIRKAERHHGIGGKE